MKSRIATCHQKGAAARGCPGRGGGPGGPAPRSGAPAGRGSRTASCAAGTRGSPTRRRDRRPASPRPRPDPTSRSHRSRAGRRPRRRWKPGSPRGTGGAGTGARRRPASSPLARSGPCPDELWLPPSRSREKPSRAGHNRVGRSGRLQRRYEIATFGGVPRLRLPPSVGLGGANAILRSLQVIDSRGSGRRWRTVAMAAGLAGVCGVVFFGSAGTASAAAIDCTGKATPSTRQIRAASAELLGHVQQPHPRSELVPTRRSRASTSPLTVVDGKGPPRWSPGQMDCFTGLGNGFGCGVQRGPRGARAIAVSPRTSPTYNTPTCPQPDYRTVRPQCATTIRAGNIVSGRLNLSKSPCDYQESDRLEALLVVVWGAARLDRDRHGRRAQTGKPHLFRVRSGSSRATSRGPHQAEAEGLQQEGAVRTATAAQARRPFAVTPNPTIPGRSPASAGDADEAEEPRLRPPVRDPLRSAVRGWSVVVNRRMDLFGAEIPVLDPVDPDGDVRDHDGAVRGRSARIRVRLRDAEPAHVAALRARRRQMTRADVCQVSPRQHHRQRVRRQRRARATTSPASRS